MRDLTYPEWRFLARLERSGGKVKGTAVPTESWPMVRRLENAGKVRITHDARGHSSVEITSHGREALRRTSYTQREAEGH